MKIAAEQQQTERCEALLQEQKQSLTIPPELYDLFRAMVVDGYLNLGQVEKVEKAEHLCAAVSDRSGSRGKKVSFLY